MRIKKRKKLNARYLPLDDIKKIDDEFLTEMECVKQRLKSLGDKDIINAFQGVLLSAYNAAIEVKTLEREVDYEIKYAEIEARRAELKPWRRCWLWRLLFQPLTNRAQDIIEERAELNADIEHTAAENAIDEDYKKLPSDSDNKRLKHKARKELKAAIKAADNADVQEVLNEPTPATADVEPAQEPTAAPQSDVQNLPQDKGQLPGQMQLPLDGLPQPGTRRPRPPRSCRKP